MSGFHHRPILCPPVLYTDIEDDDWARIFGNVNKQSLTEKDRLEHNGSHYMNRLAQHMESHAPEKEKQTEV